VDGLLAAVASAASPEERRRRGEAGRAFARVHFDREKGTRRIAELLEEAALPARSPTMPKFLDRVGRNRLSRRGLLLD
jgi:hypothetical protein